MKHHSVKSSQRGHAGGVTGVENSRLPLFELLESRMLMSVTALPGTEPSAIHADQTTGFLQADHSAGIHLAQTNQVTTVNVGAGDSSASSLTYWASPTGNGDGSQASPWSLHQANTQLQAGDTLYLKAGDYVGQIKPRQSGVAGQPIRITAAPGLNAQQVHVYGVGVSSSNALRRTVPVQLSKDYLAVDGFTVSFQNGLQVGQRGANIQVFGKNVTVRNMRVIHDATQAEGPLAPGQLGEHVRQARLNAGTKEVGISAVGSFGLYENNLVQDMWQGIGLDAKIGRTNNVVRGNTVADAVYDGIHIGGGDNTPLSHIIENNVIYGAMVSDGITMDSGVASENHGINQVVIRNNAIFNIGENAIDLKGTRNILIEGNYLWGILGDNDGSGVIDRSVSINDHIHDEQAGEAIGRGAHSTSEDVIIRNNVVIDSNGATFAPKNGKIYNNTFLNNRRNAADGANQPTNETDARKPRDAAITERVGTLNVTILNNIIGDHGYEVVTFDSAGNGGVLDGNTYYNTFQSPRFSAFADNHDWTAVEFEAWQAWLASQENYEGEVHSQVVAGGPGSLFVNVPDQVTGDPAQYDFGLSNHSEAIDAGVFLTHTVGDGSGIVLTVADGDLFFDGYGMTLGDLIQLENQSQTARIVGISGDVLTLDQSLTWSDGVGVSLAYHGLRPDAGAIESSVPTPSSLAVLGLGSALWVGSRPKKKKTHGVGLRETRWLEVD